MTAGGGSEADRLDRLAALVAAARAAGAEAADAMLVAGASLTVARRVGRVEKVERAESLDLGLRVFVGGGRAAVVATTELDPPGGYAALAARAVAMARALPEDAFAGLPGEAEVARGFDPRALDLLDDGPEPDVAALAARAAEAEEAGLAVAGVTNSEGAEASWSRTAVALAASNGFAGAYARTSHGLAAALVAGEGTGMERDYDFAAATHLADLDDAAALGRGAGERAVRRLNPRRPRTAAMPVVYDPRVANSLVGHLSAAANGASVARGTSFLRDRMGEAVMSPGVTIRDDPARPRGRRSRPFDGEGVAGGPRALVEGGVLRSWLLDARTARQLGLSTTGHAARSVAGTPSPSATNLWMEPGPLPPEALMADVREGLYVIELIGMGLNPTTGDYSRGAAGFMIRDGALAEPVAEVTVAGNLRDMFRAMTPASDLRFKRGTDAPTVRVEGMTVAGA